jgi:hypothetical protein
MPKTKIQRKELAPVVIEGAEPAPYVDSSQHSGVMDDATVSKLVKDINRLGQRDHEIIYMLLRKHKPASFFAVNGLGTCFNIFMLPDRVRWELLNVVQLSLQNSMRERQISAANEGHASVMHRLDSTLVRTVGAEGTGDVDERTRQLLDFSNN